jgi:hypothetical protein
LLKWIPACHAPWLHLFECKDFQRIPPSPSHSPLTPNVENILADNMQNPTSGYTTQWMDYFPAALINILS